MVLVSRTQRRNSRLVQAFRAESKERHSGYGYYLFNQQHCPANNKCLLSFTYLHTASLP